jgi:hypothetical protein
MNECLIDMSIIFLFFLGGGGQTSPLSPLDPPLGLWLSILGHYFSQLFLTIDRRFQGNQNQPISFLDRLLNFSSNLHKFFGICLWILRCKFCLLLWTNCCCYHGNMNWSINFADCFHRHYLWELHEYALGYFLDLIFVSEMVNNCTLKHFTNVLHLSRCSENVY